MAKSEIDTAFGGINDKLKTTSRRLAALCRRLRAQFEVRIKLEAAG